MSDGKWSGQGANRYWARPGSRRRGVAGDPERSARLAAALAAATFFCENCGGTHPLSEHAACRAAARNLPKTA
jgi:hypothetical protein